MIKLQNISMRLIKNSGNDRVVDILRQSLVQKSTLEVATPYFSIFAFGELQSNLLGLEKIRMVLPDSGIDKTALMEADRDRVYRNRLQNHWLAKQCADWIKSAVDIRGVRAALPQSTLLVSTADPSSAKAVSGGCALTTDGMGLAPGNKHTLIQCSENPDEYQILKSWFDSLWSEAAPDSGVKQSILELLEGIACHKAPSLVYHALLFNLFKDLGSELDEDKIIRAATGIRSALVWRKLFKFQRDGVIGAIDKLERIGGCIIADSVGLGKTFEALAIIKYYELRNDRVLVLCPKRLRDNWTLYKANDRRNILAADRFHYDVLNHTDLSRVDGMSGDIDLSYVNWGNYDLVVIDESHNFRNKGNQKDRETRYDRLMRKIIQAGVKTRVLMLSATPVNNRLNDLKNQIAFMTEGKDNALTTHGITSIDTTVRLAQMQFNKWLALPEEDRRPNRLMDMLGFDYFKLLDLLTIARSRKHVEKYYGIEETGRFPNRLAPINRKPDVDLDQEFPSIEEINNEIRRLNLAAYAPLRYVLGNKKAAYDDKYSTRIKGGEGFFRQADREESLVNLLRVNMLKRMESSVTSFAMTVERQLRDVDSMILKMETHDDGIEELSIEDIDIDDPTFESLLVGRKVKVLLQDADRIRWRQELGEDRNRLATLLSAARQVTSARDAKLDELKKLITAKVRNPINDNNLKIIVFTAFADTAEYLYRELADWAKKTLAIRSAIVTGAGRNQTNLDSVRTDFGAILTAFSPRSKERPEEFAAEGQIDLLIATDCISEGQNLQDCDYLVNYDIHWNPVRIIQRFGRIDRIGSINANIQLVNFWPNMELEEYINLEQRVSGRMVLLDLSATGEENVIEHQAGDQMNDLEYRRKQLIRLKDAVIDLEDLSSGISITDLTLNDFRADLLGFLREQKGVVASLPLGVFAVTSVAKSEESAVPPGVIFCLRAAGDSALAAIEPGYPLAPHYLVHVGTDGSILLPHTQAKPILDRIRRIAVGKDIPDAGAYAKYDGDTRNGKEMGEYQKLLATAVHSIVGKKEERAVVSLFKPGGTHAVKGEFSGVNEYEVTAFLVVIPQSDGSPVV
jgi:SNF2 family DNA or RNA helicase